MTLSGTVSPGLRVGLAFIGTFASSDDPSAVQMEQHYYYEVVGGDSLETVAAGIANAINVFSSDVQATASGSSVTCQYRGSGRYRDKTGSNANRIGIYGFVQQGSQLQWSQSATHFSGGAFPEAYLVSLDFSDLRGVLNDPTQFFSQQIPYVAVPTSGVRKMRWTWAPDLQAESFVHNDFNVVISNWTVTGDRRQYFVAGAGSRRVEEGDEAVVFSGPNGALDWAAQQPGNFSGSGIQVTSQTGATCTISYIEPNSHELFLGTRKISSGPQILVSIDGGQPKAFSLKLPLEDVLVRLPLGTFGPGEHTVTITHNGPDADVAAGIYYPFYFDFLEIAHPSRDLPDFSPQSQLSLATDWDTLHSQALPAERTAWMIWKLGFHGRVNHYVGALWFYELYRPGQQYASLTATVAVPATGPTGYTEIDIGSGISKVTFQHLNLPDDTASTISQALAFRINQGTNAIWAAANGDTLQITARTMGSAGNGLEFSSFSGTNNNVTLSFSSTATSGGVDGLPSEIPPSDPNASIINGLRQFWCTDLTAIPRLNRACRDWSKAFYTALASYGLDCVAAFSTELGHGDGRLETGIAQRYSDGTPATVNTPAIQTNFSETSLAYWREVYIDMAGLQASAGIVPYLQSGEVQWWYFPKPNVSMPFYDAYTQQQFTTTFGRTMPVILSNDSDPESLPEEVNFLHELIGRYTADIRNAIRNVFPGARYEVLYPTDVNAPRLNAKVNFATSDWIPANLTCLKTESFGFTADRNLDASMRSMQTSAAKGFAASQRSHLIGIGDARTAWMKESDLAKGQGLESVVLFALDQFCLIGYSLPPFTTQRWSRRNA
jgi:hypothetical protein